MPGKVSGVRIKDRNPENRKKEIGKRNKD